MAVIAAFDPRQPKAERRRRLRNRHGDALAAFAVLVVKVAVGWEVGRWRWRGAARVKDAGIAPWSNVLSEDEVYG